MPPWALKLFHAMNMGMFRVAGGWMRIQGRPLLQLTTVGAKTGQRRQTTLGYFPDTTAEASAAGSEKGESWLIVASAAGAAKHPAWYVNLAKNSDKVWVELGPERGRVRAVRPESLKGGERARAWEEVVRLAPGYGMYAEQTDRVIPIVRLRAVDG
jgi:deazaflavin-dependent oxidoreductase (nitroreductase family)